MSHTSNLAIWNAAIFIYFDTKMARRFPYLGKQFKDYILYADLRETFKEDGSTKRLIVFYPVLRNEDGLINRGIVVDEAGIFLIGGSRVAGGKKVPVALSKICKFYDLGEFEEIPMKNINGEMNPMANSSEELTIAQNSNYLFAASREVSNPSRNGHVLVEVYDKDEDKWILQFKIPCDGSVIGFDLAVLKDPKDGTEKLVFLRHCLIKGAIGIKLDIEELVQAEERQVPSLFKEIEKFNDKAIIHNEFRRPTICSTYDVSTVIKYVNFVKEQISIEEYRCFEDI